MITYSEIENLITDHRFQDLKYRQEKQMYLPLLDRPIQNTGTALLSAGCWTPILP